MLCTDKIKCSFGVTVIKNPTSHIENRELCLMYRIQVIILKETTTVNTVSAETM